MALSVLPFVVILLVGLVSAEVFDKLHLPYVTALIVAGIVIGPSGLNLFQLDPVVTLIASIGVVFVMFIAGSQTKISSLGTMDRRIFVLVVLNGGLPFACGALLGWVFGFGVIGSLVLGVALVSSSVAIIIPTLDANRLLDTEVGKTIMTATVLEDVSSLILLAFVLQSVTQTTPLPLPLYLVLLVGLIVVLKYLVPRGDAYFKARRGKDKFESELRYVIAVLLLTVVLFEFIGMHAIVAGFVIGVILSGAVLGKVEDKIKTVGYGFFIPIFFLVIGMETNLFLLLTPNTLVFTVILVGGLIGSKYISGWVGGRFMKFSRSESALIGASSIPQLSTTLGIVFAAVEGGVISLDLVSAIVVLSIVTILVSPLWMKHAVTKYHIDHPFTVDEAPPPHNV
ncbi:MAG: cation:proton antiporter [Candidatus Ranarchaeia archaeon]|jgi:Kef-type K+ transport system membrane component KefB